MKTLTPTDKIRKSDEYWDDVHNVLRPVPSFWVGDCAGLYTHMILRDTVRDNVNKENCHFN
jgi:hypothetical protein